MCIRTNSGLVRYKSGILILVLNEFCGETNRALNRLHMVAEPMQPGDGGVAAKPCSLPLRILARSDLHAFYRPLQRHASSDVLQRFVVADGFERFGCGRIAHV